MNKVQESEALLSEDFVNDVRRQWDNIQAGFVDEPREAVKQADDLVAHCVQNLTSSLSEQRNGLEQQWDKEGGVNTEDLRIALQKYRTFFNRLIAI